jgi:hypothetical protein
MEHISIPRILTSNANLKEAADTAAFVEEFASEYRSDLSRRRTPGASATVILLAS